MAHEPARLIAEELSLPHTGVSAVLRLSAEGATVPFIARYRKEATGGLDEVQIRSVRERADYLTELESRRQAVLREIERQGKLSDELRARLESCRSKNELEDLYLPYRPKRRTRAQIARERGLEPLALRILEQPDRGDPSREATEFVGPDKVSSPEEALAGAQDIVAEVIAETAEIRGSLRERYRKDGAVTVRKRSGVSGPTKFESYYDFQEPVARIPSHRYLAIRRGEAEEVLRAKIEVDTDAATAEILRWMRHRPRSPFGSHLVAAAEDALKRLLGPSIESEIRSDLKTQADEKAIDVFAGNLEALLLAAPLGDLPVIGIDPGQRTGCKVAVVDATGKVLEHDTIYLVHGDGALARAKEVLGALVERHHPKAIAVGNGTHGRETEAFVRGLLSERDQEAPFAVLVNESGASVYSASDIAREELPDLDVSIRGAVSIARRLQDPLAELVKIDPKSIGVGQYQHDVDQNPLARKLGAVVETCVNRVGADLNTASAPLLSYVAGVGGQLARRIVAHREENGRFTDRAMLKKVSGVGPRTFEQAAGFLRVRGGDEPLDASAVHPERYGVVAQIARDLGVKVGALVGNGPLVSQIDWKRYVADDLGEPTLRDILTELARPGRDPRASFEPPKFREDVHTLEDLEKGMVLEGVVTNVTAFGAFVDVGVHQDGLVHVSQLADRFVKDPAEVVKPGDRLEVRVLEVDLARRRISLSARKGERPPPPKRAAPAPREPRRPKPPEPERKSRSAPRKNEGFRNNPFADLKKR